MTIENPALLKLVAYKEEKRIDYYLDKSLVPVEDEEKPVYKQCREACDEDSGQDVFDDAGKKRRISR